MKNCTAYYQVPGIIGTCGALPVFLGFAPAKVLSAFSFADVLDEDTGEGYQRPRNRGHSHDFKKYIMREGASTIPLTFNLRGESHDVWKINRRRNGTAILLLKHGVRCLAQVDCQHRLGELGDSDVSLAFMTFIGLDLRNEMAMFVIINTKAKGLSTSLTDFHRSSLISDLIREAPHLLLARKLNEDPQSPWFKMIRYGGATTSGLKRRTSLRMMQQSIRKFLLVTRLQHAEIERTYSLLRGFWIAVSRVFPHEWEDPRNHLLTKGVGLYSLHLLLGDIVSTTTPSGLSETYFEEELSPLRGQIDWRTHGVFAGAGGHKGAHEVYMILKSRLKE